MENNDKNNDLNNIKIEILLKALELLVNNLDSVLEILDKELSMPNIPTTTMGGEVFWTNVADYNGWRLQQNMITKHARILRPDNVRIAWGTIAGMEKAINRLVKLQK